ncbi:MAG TPA: glycosyltransferase family 39 protein [Gemmatimonadales bacterium]
MWRITVLVGLFYLATIRAGHDWGDDFALYIHHARNIAARAPYAETGYIYNPHNPAIGPRIYPPGLPLLLAPVVAVFGLDLQPMKAVMVLSFVGVLLMLPRVFQRDLPPRYTAALILVMGLNPYFWDFKDQVLSDIPFLFFTLVSLYAFQRAAQADRRSLTYGALAGIASAAAIATRALGVVILPAFIASDVLRWRRVRRETALACGIIIALLLLQYVLGAQDGSYFDTLTDTPAAVGRNIVDYLRALSDIWVNGYTGAGRKIIFLVTLGLAGFGYFRALRGGPTVVELFPLWYAIPVILWPANQGTRFLIPLIPFYLYYCLLGVRGLEIALAPRRYVALAFLAIVALVYSARYSTMRYGPLADGVAAPESMELFRFVEQNTAPQDIFVFNKPRALALFTGRRASAPFTPDDPCRLWRYFTEIGATYVITGPVGVDPEAAYLERFVSRYSRALVRVMGNRTLAVYRVVGDPCSGSGLGLVA